VAACRDGKVRIIAAISLVLAAGYVGINLATQLPLFLVGENLVYASIYGSAGILLARGRCRVLPILLFASSFNAGRVSRSIVTPTGSLGVLALEHVPLLTALLAVAVLSLLAVLDRFRED